MARAKKVWSRMSRILSRERAAPWVSGSFLKAVIQAVLHFGAETWVVTTCMGKALEGFHTQVAIRLKVQLLQRKTEGVVEIHLGGGGKEGGRVIENGGIRQAAPEHSHTVYR